MVGNEENGGVSKEDQHLPVLGDEEEEDVDIDVEETSDIEQKGIPYRSYDLSLCILLQITVLR